jgi:Trypsin-co-occurring domain 1
MTSKLIKLKDGTLVEVEATGNEVQPIAGGVAKKVDATIDQIKPVLLKVCQPIVAAVKDLREDVDLEQVEVEVGLSFDIEGNIYVTKANFGANVLVRMTLKKKEK